MSNPAPEKKSKFHYLNYEYLRPSRKYITAKTKDQKHTYVKGVPVFKNIYYGVDIPEDQFEKTQEYNTFLQEEYDNGSLQTIPEYWSFHDSWRFADAAQYKKEDEVRDAQNHFPWVEEMKNFNLSAASEKILREGHIYVHGRDVNGYPNIVIELKRADTSDSMIQTNLDAIIFQTAVVKKYMMMPYFCELFNLIIDLGNTGLLDFPKNFLLKIIELPQLHFKNNMHKAVFYNVSMGFYVFYKAISLIYDSAFLERIRVIKLGQEEKFYEFLVKEQFPVKYGGTVPEITVGKFWPPRSFDSQDPVGIITQQEIIENELMTFDFIGHQSDVNFFKSYIPWESNDNLNESGFEKFNTKLDVVYDEN